METLRLFYLQNQSAINLICVVLAFFIVAWCLTNLPLIQSKANMTPPYAPNKCMESFQTESSTDSSSEKFPYLTEGYYIISGSRGNEYCSDDPNGIICNRNFVKDWEKFYVKPLGNNIYAIRGGRGQWCRSSPVGLVCDADNFDSPDTQFKIYGLGRGNKYGFRSLVGDPDFPSWCADYGNGLRCDHRDYNSMEIFTFYKVDPTFEGGDEKRWC